MKNYRSGVVMLLATFLIGGLVGFGCSQSETQSKAEDSKTEAAKKKPQRFGSVIGLKAEKKDYYNKLHAEPWPEINAMIKKCNIQNYSIYEIEIEGKLYLFSYFEYVGDDFDADMEKMKPLTRRPTSGGPRPIPARSACPAPPTASNG